MELRNRKIEEEEFLEWRKEVLAQWPTGKDVDLDEAIEYHKSLPPSKNHVLKLLDAKKKGITLVHSNMGFTTLEQNKDLLRSLQNEGGSQFLRTIQDSLTRTKRFAEAEKAVKEAEKTNKNLLNGFPAVVYGVKKVRELQESVDMPMAVAGPTIDSRLSAEICLAAGYTSAASGGGVGSWVGYSKNTPYETAVNNALYGCALHRYYKERGVPMGVGGIIHAPLNVTGATPPSLGSAFSILNVSVALTQGATHLSTGAKSQGNLIQDVASNVARMELVREYADKFGAKDIEIFLSNGCIDGPYPADHAQAIVVALQGPMLSALTKAQSCWIKTIDEADAIPTKENNIFSLRAAKMMIDILSPAKIDLMNSKQVRDEVEQEKREAKAIAEKVFEFGDGDPIIGARKAFEQGVLDWPLANNKNVKAKVMGVKDAEGAVRYLDFGNLPFSKEMKEFHREKVADRGKSIGKELDYDIVVSDVLALSRGSLLSNLG
ncbi:methylaspartate mutase subunit E [Thermodesulfobacteriota bacterium]